MSPGVDGRLDAGNPLDIGARVVGARIGILTEGLALQAFVAAVAVLIRDQVQRGLRDIARDLVRFVAGGIGDAIVPAAARPAGPILAKDPERRDVDVVQVVDPGAVPLFNRGRVVVARFLEQPQGLPPAVEDLDKLFRRAEVPAGLHFEKRLRAGLEVRQKGAALGARDLQPGFDVLEGEHARRLTCAAGAAPPAVPARRGRRSGPQAATLPPSPRRPAPDPQPATSVAAVATAE